MSEDSTDAPVEKKSKAFPITVIVLLVILGSAMFFSLPTNIEDPSSAPENAEQVDTEVAENTEETKAQDAETRDVDPAELQAPNAAALPVDISIVKKERVLGNPDAPVKISEHSSFSCGHCAKFHNTTFKEFKTNWLDTGKAYLVFSDFPLNAPALHASLATRCIEDDEQYFAAVEELFAAQKDWAYTADYMTPLKAILAKYGLNGDTVDACINNIELQEALLGKVRATQQQFGVNSTPSFVVNNAVTVSGGTSYEQFNTILEKAIEESNNPTDTSSDGAEEGSP